MLIIPAIVLINIDLYCVSVVKTKVVLVSCKRVSRVCVIFDLSRPKFNILIILLVEISFVNKYVMLNSQIYIAKIVANITN